MSYYSIKSKLDGNVIDIEGASSAAGALLDAYPAKSNAANQLWEFVADPAGSGYFFIKSKLSGNVIDVQNTAPGSPIIVEGLPINVTAQKSSNYKDQLWQFVQDPAGSGYCFIMNSSYGSVIDIKGASTTAGAALNTYPMKSSGTDNQLWEVVGGSFPATVKTLSNAGLGSNNNYMIYGNCKTLTLPSVFIEITQDMVCQSIAPPNECPPGGTNQTGFGFQMNCWSATGYKCAWQQYVVAFWENSSGGFDIISGVDNWPLSGGNIINSGFPVIGTLPKAVLPAGYQVAIVLVGSASSPNSIEFAIFSVYDNQGNKVCSQDVTIASISGANAGDLAPMTSFEMDIVGPINGLIATLSSGAGYIVYSSVVPIEVFVPTGSSAEPPCSAPSNGTCEEANTFYGPLPANSNGTLKQSFNVSSSASRIVRRGVPRPSTRFYGR